MKDVSTTNRPGVFLLLISAAMCFPLFPARAEAPLEITLVSEFDSIQPGRAFTVALRLKHGSVHHSYWKFPGLVGIPTAIQWDLPDDWTAGELQWPAPEHVNMRGTMAHGYHGTKLILATVRPPPKIADKSITLRGKTQWMACSQKKCTPGFVDVSLTLPVAESDPRPTQWRKLFVFTRRNMPIIASGWHVAARVKKKTVLLTITPPETTRLEEVPPGLYFFSEDGLVISHKPQKFKVKNGVIHARLPRNEFGPKDPGSLRGVLHRDGGWNEHKQQITLSAEGAAFRCDAPLPRS